MPKGIDELFKLVPEIHNLPFGVTINDDGEGKNRGVYWHLTNLLYNREVKALAEKDPELKKALDNIDAVAQVVLPHSRSDEEKKEKADDILQNRLSESLKKLYDKLDSRQKKEGEIEVPLFKDGTKQNLKNSIAYLSCALDLKLEGLEITEDVRKSVEADTQLAEQLAQQLKKEELDAKRAKEEAEKRRKKDSHIGTCVDEIRVSDNLYEFLEMRKAAALDEKNPSRFQEDVLDILAARMAGNAPRNRKSVLKSTALGNPFVDEFKQAREKLAANSAVREYLSQNGSSLYQRLRNGHGGRLEEEMRKAFLSAPAAELKDIPERFRPTAKERIEYLQGRLSKIPRKDRDGEAAQNILCEIAGIRAAVNAVRNHKASLEKPYDPERALNAAEGVRPAIVQMVNMTKKENPGAIAKAALSGHGGKLEDHIRQTATSLNELIEKRGQIPDFYTNPPKNGKNRVGEKTPILRDSAAPDMSRPGGRLSVGNPPKKHTNDISNDTIRKSKTVKGAVQQL